MVTSSSATREVKYIDIPTTKLIRKKSRNLYVIFSCLWGITFSRINDLFICPPKYYFRFISLIGYTLFLLATAPLAPRGSVFEELRREGWVWGRNKDYYDPKT